MENYIFFNNNDKKTRLIVGEVQSGKTRQIIKKVKNSIVNDKHDVIIVFGGTNNLLLKQTIIRFTNEFLKERVKMIELKDSNRKSLPNDKSIVLALKGNNSLDKLTNLIKNENRERRFLILDDESDFGGINIGKNKDSAIFRKLRKIFNTINDVEFISITATPYADILSEHSFNFDRVDVLETNSEYTGIEKFEKGNNYVICDIGNKAREINNKFWTKVIIDHIKRSLSSKEEKTQLLINTELSNNEQLKIKNRITSILEILSKSETDILFPKQKNNEVFLFIENLKKGIILLNQKNSKNERERNEIIIGGSLVSRGFTFENLITVVMLNAPDRIIAADTLLQRARWFGYRNKVWKHLKIYINRKIKDAYREAYKLQKLVYDYLKENKYNYNKEKIDQIIKKQKFNHIKPTGESKYGNKKKNRNIEKK